MLCEWATDREAGDVALEGSDIERVRGVGGWAEAKGGVLLE